MPTSREEAALLLEWVENAKSVPLQEILPTINKLPSDIKTSLCYVVDEDGLTDKEIAKLAIAMDESIFIPKALAKIAELKVPKPRKDISTAYARCWILEPTEENLVDWIEDTPKKIHKVVWWAMFTRQIEEIRQKNNEVWSDWMRKNNSYTHPPPSIENIMDDVVFPPTPHPISTNTEIGLLEKYTTDSDPAAADVLKLWSFQSEAVAASVIKKLMMKTRVGRSIDEHLFRSLTFNIQSGTFVQPFKIQGWPIVAAVINKVVEENEGAVNKLLRANVLPSVKKVQKLWPGCGDDYKQMVEMLTVMRK